MARAIGLVYHGDSAGNPDLAFTACCPHSDKPAVNTNQDSPPKPLRYRYVWLSLGIAWLALLIYLSVTSNRLPQTTFLFADKLNHLLAYGLVMGWFGQLYTSTQSRLLIAVCLIALGMLLEIVQSMLPHRWFDYYDAAANAAGVVLALSALKIGCDRLLLWFENSVLRSDR